MKNFKNLITSNLKFLIFILTIISYNISLANSYSLYQMLDHYNFSTMQQKKALENLMQHANILEPKQSFEDYYPARGSSVGLAKDILSFVRQAQQHFHLRKGVEERWEMKPVDWIVKNREQIIEDAKELGFVDEAKPSLNEVDAVCILGSSLPSMQARIDFIAEIINKGKLKTKNIILLAGERKVNTKVDGSEQSLLQIAKKYNVNDLDKLTETHLIQEAYKNSAIYNKLQVFVIDTPAYGLPRPTTETTVKELNDWLAEHKDIKTIVFVSNQPHIQYQQAIIFQILKYSSPHIVFETVGPSVPADVDPLALIEALGSYIWARTPAVITKLGKITADKSLLIEFEELYKKNILIYSGVKNLFESAP